MADHDRFARAIARFDEANAEDPYHEWIDGRQRPKELVYAERLSAMLERFERDASEPLRLAARCQHIRRWRISRAEYPQDRIGYLQWRKELNAFHARTAGEILRSVGYPEATIARVGTLLRKQALKSDPEAQMLEDVVALVFLESYLASFVAAHPEYNGDKFTDILRKTAKKMSQRGRAAALELIALPESLAPLVRSVMTSAPPDTTASPIASRA